MSLYDFQMSGMQATDLTRIHFCLHSTKTGVAMKIFTLSADDPGDKWIISRVVQFMMCKVKYSTPSDELGGPFFNCSTKGGSSGRTLYSKHLTDDMVSGVVKWAARELGLNPFAFSSHSNRRGGITDLRSRPHQSKDEVMAVSGHKTEKSFDLYDYAAVEGGSLSGRGSSGVEEDVTEEVIRLRHEFGSLRVAHRKQGDGRSEKKKTIH